MGGEEAPRPEPGRDGGTMKRVKHTGEGYHGFDVEMDRWIFVKTGEVVDVSDGKADQLFADFPTMWVEIKPVTEELKAKGKK